MNTVILRFAQPLPLSEVDEGFVMIVSANPLDACQS